MVQREARKYPRIRVSIPVDGDTEKHTFHVRATSLGGGGMFLGIMQLLSPDAELSLRFRAAKHLSVIEVRARVRYQLEGKGVGIEFIEISPEHRQILLRLIHHRMVENRRFPRAPLATQIEFQGSTSIAFSRDVSAGGMFIEIKDPLPAGSQFNLRFHLDDGGSIVAAVARVVYEIGKLGMGVNFTELTTEDQKRIEAYVARAQAAD